MSEILLADKISIRFGGLQAVDSATFSVAQGELLGLIGPNGAGKTTALSLITGRLKLDSGHVLLSGKDISRLPTHERVRLGIAMTHQIVRPFYSLTVLENVVLAAGIGHTGSALGAMTRLSRSREEDSARGLLKRIGLADHEGSYPGVLPLGFLKRLEVARALALQPKILLLDEPLAGLNQKETNDLANAIQQLSRDGMTVILVEHNLGQVLRIASRLVVLDGGKVIADGNPDLVMENQGVREAYLGKPRVAHA
ncbi:MAG: ABC transporter ATP-binding protein [Thermodesulfobacteriota bacterium]